MTGPASGDGPIFVRSTENYPSYADFWRLVELSGFQTVRANEADLGNPGACYVWVEMDPGSLEHLIRLERTRSSRVVWWYLERPDANPRPGIPPEEMFRQAVGEVLSWVDQVWVSDRGLQRIEPETCFAVLGSHPGLAEPAESGRPLESWDATHVGQRTPRRIAAIERLRNLGYSVAEPSYGPERARMLSGSRALVGIDRVEGLHVGAPLRWALAAAHRLAIVNEEVPDPSPLVPGKSIVLAPYDELPEAVAGCLARDPGAMGEAAWRKLCLEWTFRKGVLEALKEGHGP